ncbi:hypothetical protein ACFVX6_25770 [Streptomyces sp. NPDC058289]|uniref:hypothetical protein n=1 Tax=Streptomyces sp. NPDC058289 TaxID=3346425 RepID=UPI0036EE81F6
MEGTHFTRGTDGGPVPTQLATWGGDGPRMLPLYYVSAAPQALYYPDQPEAVKLQHAWTQVEVALTQHREDAIKDVITGRKKLSDWTAVVQDHLRKGGRQAAEALARECEAAQKA